MAKVTSRILVIDIEATCWNYPSPVGNDGKPQESEIIEIGICDLSRENADNEWRVAGSESIIVKPQRSTVSQFCTDLTSLTQKDVDKGMDFFYACRRLEDVYDSKRRPWASWGDYDRTMFQKQCKAHVQHNGAKGVRYPFGETHWNMKDLYSLLRKLDREVGMAEALKLEDMPLKGTHHRGVDDAYNTARILAKILPS